MPQSCVDRLVAVGLCKQVEVDSNGAASAFKFNHPYFDPVRHIPTTVPSDDLNISPVDGYTFSICRSMQNIQLLIHCNGVLAYVCKYIGKIDEQNYVVTKVDGCSGKLVNRYQHLHNTKVATSKFHEDQARQNERDRDHPHGRAISLNKMLHGMLGYPEVYTDITSVQVSSLPIELRAGVDCKFRNENNDLPIADAAEIGIVSSNVRLELGLSLWRQHTDNEIQILKDIKQCPISVDKISQFGVRPPELRHLFNRVDQYYCWFIIQKGKTISGSKLHELISEDLKKSIFVDGMQQQIKLRMRAIPEIRQYFEELTSELAHDDIYFDDLERESITVMIGFFNEIYLAVNNEHDDTQFTNIVKKHLVDDDSDRHLPDIVFTYVKPTLNVQYLLHILLSMGRFETEIDLLQHASLRQSFRFAKLIGLSDDPIDLQRYSNELLKKIIINEMVWYPNARQQVNEWIVVAGDLIDSVIINDEIPITDLPPVQLTSLYSDPQFNEHKNKIKSNVIDAAFEELKEDTIIRFEIPSKDVLLSSTKESPCTWNPVDTM
mmetsp:Transcript_19481/g.27406  ORF Transcript_19481/g.27406 Transcript_19481/m.27406 type:complete len:548 (+) Transcript_19481:1364-3007(+)